MGNIYFGNILFVLNLLKAFVHYRKILNGEKSILRNGYFGNILFIKTSLQLACMADVTL